MAVKLLYLTSWYATRAGETAPIQRGLAQRRLRASQSSLANSVTTSEPMYLELSPRLPSSDERSVQTFATRIPERAGVTIGRLRGAAHPPRRYPCRQ